MGKKKKAKKKLIAGIKSRMYFFTAVVAILITGWTAIGTIAYADLEVCKTASMISSDFKSSGPVGFVLSLNKKK